MHNFPLVLEVVFESLARGSHIYTWINEVVLQRHSFIIPYFCNLSTALFVKVPVFFIKFCDSILTLWSSKWRLTGFKKKTVNSPRSLEIYWSACSKGTGVLPSVFNSPYFAFLSMPWADLMTSRRTEQTACTSLQITSLSAVHISRVPEDYWVTFLG